MQMVVVLCTKLKRHFCSSCSFHTRKLLDALLITYVEQQPPDRFPGLGRLCCVACISIRTTGYPGFAEFCCGLFWWCFFVTGRVGHKNFVLSVATCSTCVRDIQAAMTLLYFPWNKTSFVHMTTNVQWFSILCTASFYSSWWQLIAMTSPPHGLPSESSTKDLITLGKMFLDSACDITALVRRVNFPWNESTVVVSTADIYPFSTVEATYHTMSRRSAVR